MSVAGFLGSTLTESYLFPDSSTTYNGEGLQPTSYTVGSGVEYGNTYFNVDISDNTIAISFNISSGWNDFSFNGPLFADITDSLADVTGVTIDTNVPGLDLSDLNWNANAIWLNWANTPFGPSYYVNLNVSFDHVVNFDATSWSWANPYSEDGLTFTAADHIHFETDMDGDSKPELSGHAGGTDVIEITKTGGGTFSLVEMDTAAGAYGQAGQVEWIAYRWDGSDFVETGRMVITPGDHVTFTDDFYNIDKVVWNSAYTGDGGMSVDNIRFSTGHFDYVPTNTAPDAPTDGDPTGDGVGVAATIAEDHAVGTAIGLTATATDPDGDTLSYSFGFDLNGDPVLTDGHFTIDATTGVVTLTSAVNYEDATSHVLTIYATDPDGESSSASFTVAVTNVAPGAPSDSDVAPDTLAENAVADTYTGVTAAATDVNGGTVTYVMTADAGGRFKVDATTGQILATGAVNIDYETAPNVDLGGRYYEVTVKANDGTDLSSATTFKIYVTNVVEHLFTPGNDGSAADPIDFNLLPDGAYDFDGAQYNALAGDDYVILPDRATVDAGNPWNYGTTFAAGDGNDVIQGGDGNDIVSGGAGNDTLFGGDGDDRLVGAAGNDIIGGGDGADKLTGSDGRDIFVFTDSELGTTRLGEHDVITDFKQGTDRIDISALYDGGTYGGLKSGKLNGSLSNAYKVGYYSEGGKTWLEGDVSGDGVADFVIEMSGSYKLKGSDLLVADSALTSQAQWTAATSGLDYDKYHQDNFFLV